MWKRNKNVWLIIEDESCSYKSNFVKNRSNTLYMILERFLLEKYYTNYYLFFLLKFHLSKIKIYLKVIILNFLCYINFRKIMLITNKIDSMEFLLLQNAPEVSLLGHEV
jgi:hypothetical protein